MSSPFVVLSAHELTLLASASSKSVLNNHLSTLAARYGITLSELGASIYTTGMNSTLPAMRSLAVNAAQRVSQWGVQTAAHGLRQAMTRGVSAYSGPVIGAGAGTVSAGTGLGTLVLGLIAVVVIVGGLYATWRVYDTYQSRRVEPPARAAPAPPVPGRIRNSWEVGPHAERRR